MCPIVPIVVKKRQIKTAIQWRVKGIGGLLFLTLSGPPTSDADRSAKPGTKKIRVNPSHPRYPRAIERISSHCAKS